MHNARDPDRMTADERLREIGQILAAGLRTTDPKAHAA